MSYGEIKCKRSIECHKCKHVKTCGYYCGAVGKLVKQKRKVKKLEKKLEAARIKTKKYEEESKKAWRTNCPECGSNRTIPKSNKQMCEVCSTYWTLKDLLKHKTVDIKVE